MAKIGCKHFTVAPITSYADGSAPVYGDKVTVEYLVGVDMNFEYASDEMHGDDLLRESYKGLVGLTAGVSLTDLAHEVAATMLGWEKGPGKEYAITDKNPPYIGFGYIACGMKNGVRYYDAIWVYRSQFTKDSMTANTKERNVTFNPDGVTGAGYGVILNESGVATFVATERFATETEADAFINSHITKS